MSTSVARSFNEAVQWARSHNPFKSTHIMPVYGDDKVIGVRKASFWEGLTVRFYSESRRRDINIACAIGLKALREQDAITISSKNKASTIQFANGSVRTIERRSDALADGKNVQFLIKHGLLPLGSISSQVDSEPSTKKVVHKGEPNRKWAHSPIPEASFRVAVPMATQQARRTNFPFAINPSVDVSRAQQFSFIPAGSYNLVPKSFPQRWSHFAPTFSDDGVLSDNIKTKWVFNRALENGNAIYTTEDGIGTQEFALKDLVTQPDNLLHEGPDGSLTLWRMRHDPLNNQIRWMVLHHDAHGNIIKPVDKPENRDSLINALISQKNPWRPCPNPFLFVGNTDEPEVTSAPSRSVRFADDVELHKEDTTELKTLSAPVDRQALSKHAYDDVYNKSLELTREHLVEKKDEIERKIFNLPRGSQERSVEQARLKQTKGYIREIVDVQRNKANEKRDVDLGLPYPGLEKNRAQVRVSEAVEKLMHRLRDGQITRDRISPRFTPNSKLEISVKEQTLRAYGRHEGPVTFQRLKDLDTAIIQTRNDTEYHDKLVNAESLKKAQNLAKELRNIARTVDAPSAEQLLQRSQLIGGFENLIQHLADKAVVFDTLADIYDADASNADVATESLTYRGRVGEFKAELEEFAAPYKTALAALKETFAEDIDPIFPNTHHVPQERTYSMAGPSLDDLVEPIYESEAEIDARAASAARRAAAQRPLPETPDDYVDIPARLESAEDEYVTATTSPILGANQIVVEAEVYDTPVEFDVVSAPVALTTPAVKHISTSLPTLLEDLDFVPEEHPIPVVQRSQTPPAIVPVIEVLPRQAQEAVITTQRLVEFEDDYATVAPRSPRIPAELDTAIDEEVNRVLPTPFPEPMAGVTPEELENFLRAQIVPEQFASESDYDLPTDAKALLAARSAQTVISDLLARRPAAPVIPRIEVTPAPLPTSSYALPADALAAIEELDQEAVDQEFEKVMSESESSETSSTEELLQDIDNFQTNAKALLARFDEFIGDKKASLPPLTQHEDRVISEALEQLAEFDQLLDEIGVPPNSPTLSEQEAAEWVAELVNDAPPLNQGNPPSLTGPEGVASPIRSTDSI